ncbi:hypothetical protein DB347_13525 [Opitutaceae bacterium EW11]|nr:hypothetical protein DB347_13525 [Opitutaceae bacterium EW11]
MSVKMGTKGGTAIDYGTGFANVDQLVSGPWWLNGGLANLRGDFGPDSATVRYLYRADRQVYFHITFFPSYAEANLGFFWIHVRGCYASFTSLPSDIAQGDSFTATALGQDDEGRLSTVTVQVSESGGAWTTLGTSGGGNGWTSTSPGATLTAGAAGTTYQFRAWATDTNGYQSRTVTSSVYTTTPPPPPTNYLSPSGDVGLLFKVRNGGARAASTGLTCVVNGTTYDLADLFQPRASAARANVGFVAADGQDLAAIFEKK